MENNAEQNLDPVDIEIPKIKEAIKEKITEKVDFSELKKNFPEFNIDSKVTDIFFDSMKNFFDLSLKLIDKINLDFLFDTGKVSTEKAEKVKKE